MKIANILLLSASVVALAACGKSQTDTANPGDTAAPTTEETPTEEAPVEEAPAEEAPAEEAPAEEAAAE
jgi:hypothetical protein